MTTTALDLAVHADRETRRDAAQHLNYDPAQHRTLSTLEAIAAQLNGIDGGLHAGAPTGYEVSTEVNEILNDFQEMLAELGERIASRTVYQPATVRHLTLVGGAS